MPSEWTTVRRAREEYIQKVMKGRVLVMGPEHNRHARRKQERTERRLERAYKRVPGATKQSIGKELTSLAYAAWHVGLITDSQLKLLGGRP